MAVDFASNIVYNHHNANLYYQTMKTLRQQVIERIEHLGGMVAEYYNDYSDYDLLEDYENLLRTTIEEELSRNEL